MSDLVNRLHQQATAKTGLDIVKRYETLEWRAADRIENMERLLRAARNCVEEMASEFNAKHDVQLLADIDAALSGTTPPDGLVEALRELLGVAERSGWQHVAINTARTALTAHRGDKTQAIGAEVSK